MCILIHFNISIFLIIPYFGSTRLTEIIFLSLPVKTRNLSLEEDTKYIHSKHSKHTYIVYIMHNLV